jgi:hypothetical protein
MTLTQILITGGVLLVFIGIFIGTYLLNKKTPKPEGCVSPQDECKACGVVSCSHHPVNQEQKEDK